MMRSILAVIVLGSVLLGCTPPSGAPPATGFATDAARPLDVSAISAQPLAAAPISGRVIGAPVAAPSGAQISSAAPNAAPLSPTSESPAAIGAAATQILRAPASSPPASPEETLCLAQGGRWGNAGSGGAQTCFRPAKDAGKQCSKQSDCTTQCLARSGTCAPFWPIFGCTEVMQNNGAVARLCLE